MASKFVALALFSLALIGLALAHGHQIYPYPRSGANTAPKAACTATAGDVKATFEAGKAVDLQWSITACHCTKPTTIKWFLSYDGDPKNLEQIGSTLTLPKNAGNGVRTSNIVIPKGKTCEKCLLSGVWQSDETAPYIGCADIKITGSNDEEVLCKSGLIQCNSAATLGLSAVLSVLFAVALFFL